MGMPIMMPGGGGGSTTGGEGGGVAEAGAEASDRSVNSAASVMGSEMAGDAGPADSSPGGLFGDEAPEPDPFLDETPGQEPGPGAFDDFDNEGESFSSEGGDAGDAGSDEGGGLLSSIWDMMNDD